MKWGKWLLGSACLLLLGLLADSLPVPTYADSTAGGFNLQVTPSPLVATVKPGTKAQLELKVRNGSTSPENLKIEPRSFSYDSHTGKVDLDDTAPPAIAPWISFSAPKFTVLSGQWFNEEITLNLPKSAGFSYSFALTISRQADPQVTNGERLIRGSVAVFTLVNVDRPGANTKLEVTKFSTSKHIYEYLPTTFSVRFRNTGNTIAQPYGNIFVQRNTNSPTPFASLAVNETKGYILPGSERTTTTTWADGFPAYQATTNADGSTSQKLVWNWANLSKLRIGRYTAHLVAVYNQAGHDVPIEGTVSFWVIPWKILLGFLVITLLLLFAICTLIRLVIRFVRRKHARKKVPQPASSSASDDRGTF